MTPTRRRGLVAEAERYLRRRIVSGEIAAGTRLHQEQVAQMLGMSVTPVREAFVGLASDGWVVLQPNRGAFVRPITYDSVEEYAELSRLVMGFIVRRAIDRGSHEQAERIVQLAGDVGAATSPRAMWSALREFNLYLCDVAEASRARSLLRRVGTFIDDDIFEFLPESVGNTKRLIAEIAGAVLDADHARADALVEEYLDQHLQALVAWLRARGVLSDEPGSDDGAAASTGAGGRAEI